MITTVGAVRSGVCILWKQTYIQVLALALTRQVSGVLLNYCELIPSLVNMGRIDRIVKIKNSRRCSLSINSPHLFLILVFLYVKWEYTTSLV